MPSLPNELLEIIIGHVRGPSSNHRTRRDLGNLRLASKRLNGIATPFLFRTIPLWISLKSLQNLTAVSEHESISKCVTGIYISLLSFNPDTYRRNVNIMEEELERKCKTLNDFQLTVTKYNQTLKSYMDTTEALLSNGYALKVLVRNFSSLPNLNRAKIILDDRRSGAIELEAAFQFMSGRGLCWDGHDTLRLFFTALEQAGTQLKVIISTSFQWKQPPALRVLIYEITTQI